MLNSNTESFVEKLHELYNSYFLIKKKQVTVKKLKIHCALKGYKRLFINIMNIIKCNDELFNLFYKNLKNRLNKLIRIVKSDNFKLKLNKCINDISSTSNKCTNY